MARLGRSMRWDEERFGREYDLDVFNIVAVSDFNMGAMENKGLNIFNDALVLASPETATDGTFAGIERVIGHEYFHNWTGNRITCRDWFQLCLKEGLTVFRDQEFCADQRFAAVQRIREVRYLKMGQFPEDSGPLAHPVRPDRYIEINNFYTATVYRKGAEVVRMLQTLLGRDGFRKGMDLYFERHDGQAVTVEDFVACFARLLGAGPRAVHDVVRAGRDARAGVPARLRSSGEDRGSHVPPGPAADPRPADQKPLHIPVRLGLLGGNGQDLDLTLASGEPLENGLAEIRKRTEKLRFRDVPSRPVVSLLRGFSAPVNLTIDRTDAELQFLMANDSDLFNRWQAAQEYATRVLLEAVAARRRKERAPQPKGFIEALGVTLADASLEPDYLAQFLVLPSEPDLARTIASRRRSARDPPGARWTAQGHRHTAARGLARQRLRKHGDPRPYSPAPEQVGRRTLRNVALEYLTSRGSIRRTLPARRRTSHKAAI